ncbi:MAG: hypothetical protein ACFFHV_15520 [Promethearchaeota archaeon]
MRIKIFEELLPLVNVFKTIEKSIKSKFRISNNSQMFKNSFLIIAINQESYALIIRGSKGILKNRLIISVVVLDVNAIPILLKSKKNLKVIENYLYELVITEFNNKVLDPFKKILVESKVNSQHKNKILIAERNVLNQILQVLYEEFNYNDDLMKFPFSVFNIDRTWEFWVKIYGKYLKKIETTIVKSNKNAIKTYKYYDFALPKEFFPRIIDLIIIENSKGTKNSINIRETKELDKEADTDDNFKKSVKRIGFIYAYKKRSPMRLIDVLKLTEEVIKFIHVFKNKSINKDTEIKPVIILLSLYGYEKRIGKYLRDHLHHDYKHFIPIFIAPPIDNEIWHNFDANKDLSQEDEVAKNRAKQYINLYKKDSKSYKYIKHNIQDAKENYSEILDREKEAKENFEFVDRWYKILNIDKLSELLNVMDDKHKDQDEIDKIKILSEW